MSPSYSAGVCLSRNRRTAYAGSGVSEQVTDLRLLSSSSKLFAYFDCSLGSMVTNSVPRIISAGPSVTLGGDLTVPKGLYIDCESSTRFRWSDTPGLSGAGGLNPSGGWHWNQTNQLIPNGGSFAAGDWIINFPAGAYTAAHAYQSGCSTWKELTGRANCDLTNTLSGGIGPDIYTRGFNDRLPFINCWPSLASGYLANHGALPTIVNGVNTPFHFFFRSQIASVSGSLAVAAFCFANSTAAAVENITSLWAGPSVSSGQAYTFQRRAPSGSSVITSLAAPLDLSPHIDEYEFTGSVINRYIDGILLYSAAMSTAAAMTCNRFILGAVKLGTGAVGNQPLYGNNMAAFYNATLTSGERLEVLRSLS